MTVFSELALGAVVAIVLAAPLTFISGSRLIGAALLAIFVGSLITGKWPVAVGLVVALLLMSILIEWPRDE
jgi:hypothetical protein